MTINLITATHLDFEPFIGQTFNVEIEGGKLDLILDNIILRDDLKPRDNHLKIEDVVYVPRTPFSLTFQGPREPILGTMTYSVTHPKIGKMHLFISAFRQDSDCVLYESAFS